MSKRNPIIPLVINGLSLGIPAIIEAVEKSKARKAAKRAEKELDEQELEAIASSAADSAGQAAKTIGTSMASIGAAIGAADQVGAGAELMSAITSLPTELLPDHAPEWVQITYMVITVAGLIVRVLAARYHKPANTPI
jgi:hypothetical protein